MQQPQITYSVPIGPRRPGQSSIYRHKNSVNELAKPPADIRNMQELWLRAARLYGKNKCLEDLTYEQVDDMTKYLGSWLVDNGFKLVYIHSVNRVEWTLVDIACLKYGIVTVALYDTLGKEALDHTLNLTGGKCTAQSLIGAQALIKANPSSLKNITHMILFDQLDPILTKDLSSHGIKLFPIRDIISKKLSRPYPKIPTETPFSYCFTSGTTGLPKGVITTHLNMISQIFAVKGQLSLAEGDVHLSYLPLAHTFERVFIHQVFGDGGHVRYFSGSMLDFGKDLARVRPTMLVIVPRLLNMFYAMLKPFAHVDPKLAEEAWAVKQANWQKGITTSPYDQTVFKKAKDAFGGRVRRMVTGSAPIAAQVLRFFMIVLGCDIREGYGQTQTTAGTFFTFLGEKTAGHVGGVNPAVQFKLVDIPEMNYFSDKTPPTGEICVRGDPIFKGYYKDEKNTKEAIDAEGWHHTGDVGLIQENGALRIIDRKKNIYKLSQGEYIAPEKIENIYLRCPLAAEAFVYGDSLQSYNIAIVVPNKDLLVKIATEKGINKSFEELCKDRAITQLIFDLITQQGKNDGLVGFELAKKIRLHPTSFGNYGIFTNTLKLQRHIAKQAFEKDIAELYKEPV